MPSLAAPNRASFAPLAKVGCPSQLTQACRAGGDHRLDGYERHGAHYWSSNVFSNAVAVKLQCLGCSGNVALKEARSASCRRGIAGVQRAGRERLQQTDSGRKNFRTGRSKPVTELCDLASGNEASRRFSLTSCELASTDSRRKGSAHHRRYIDGRVLS